MNEQAGPASALSVLIVGAFAILLHDKDRPPPPPGPGPSSAASEVPGPRDREASPPEPAPVPRIETSLVAPVPKAPLPEARPPRTELAGPVGAPSRPALGHDRAPAPIRRDRPVRARGDFTVVEPGETLAEVAERVYGSRRAAESLWKANRDQLAGLDSPLRGGTLLRTP